MAKVFVFGSNREGRHGAGAALEAKRNHGAIYGQPIGRQGNSYAIVTKELRSSHPPVTLNEIDDGVYKFIMHAVTHPMDTFYVTKIGCGLAGFKEDQIKDIFVRYAIPTNIQLPPGW